MNKDPIFYTDPKKSDELLNSINTEAYNELIRRIMCNLKSNMQDTASTLVSNFLRTPEVNMSEIYKEASELLGWSWMENPEKKLKFKMFLDGTLQDMTEWEEKAWKVTLELLQRIKEYED